MSKIKGTRFGGPPQEVGIDRDHRLNCWQVVSELEITHKVANNKKATRLLGFCDGRMSKPGYQLWRAVAGDGSRRRSALKLLSKKRRSSKSPQLRLKTTTTTKANFGASRLPGPAVPNHKRCAVLKISTLRTCRSKRAALRSRVWRENARRIHDRDITTRIENVPTNEV
jgi:hypothetical protein